MFDDLFHATVTVDATHADRAAMRARVYRVKHLKNGKSKVTGWFATEAAALAWEGEFGEKVVPLQVDPDAAQHSEGYLESAASS